MIKDWYQYMTSYIYTPISNHNIVCVANWNKSQFKIFPIFTSSCTPLFCLFNCINLSIEKFLYCFFIKVIYSLTCLTQYIIITFLHQSFFEMFYSFLCWSSCNVICLFLKCLEFLKYITCSCLSPVCSWQTKLNTQLF